MDTDNNVVKASRNVVEERKGGGWGTSVIVSTIKKKLQDRPQTRKEYL